MSEAEASFRSLSSTKRGFDASKHSMKTQDYRDARPAAYFDKYYAYARSHRPNWVYLLAKAIFVPYCKYVRRLQVDGLEHVPMSGRVIVSPVHLSAWDHFMVGAPIRRRVRFVAKSQLFKTGLAFILSRGGCIPVRRGLRDEEMFSTVAMLLSKGEIVVKYFGGGRSRTGEPEAQAKYGVGRAVQESGAPVVPVAIFGTQFTVNNRRRLWSAKVYVRYGAPMEFDIDWAIGDPERLHEQHREVADQVMVAALKAYSDLKTDHGLWPKSPHVEGKRPQS